MEIDEREAQRILATVVSAGRGDAQAALALLQGAFVELAIRTVQELPSEEWVDALAVYCETAMAKLKDARDFYTGARSSRFDDRQQRGALSSPQTEGRRFAEQLYFRLQASDVARMHRRDEAAAEVEWADA